VGTIGPDGATYETLIDLSHRIVLGTWDKSKLKNQIVASGEILFEPFSGFVGNPTAPFLNPILTDANYDGLLSWTQERADLVQFYVISISVNFGPFTILAIVNNGLIFNYTTAPLDKTKTYEFTVHSVSADGASPESNIQTLLAIPATPSAVLSITSISTSFSLPKILQSAQGVFNGVSSDSISLPNPVRAGNMVLFAQTMSGIVPTITDNHGAAYTNVEGLLFSTTNLVTGPLTVSYNLGGGLYGAGVYGSGNYGTPSPLPTFISGPVYLFEISNNDTPLINGVEDNSLGASFTTTYATTTPNSIEILHVTTGGVLSSNPFTTAMGNSTIPPVGFFNLGKVDREFVGQYTDTFSQNGSGNWAVTAANVNSEMVGIANLVWTQSHQENVAGYLVQQQISGSPPGPFVTIATINDPTVKSFNVPLLPVTLNSGVMSTMFTFQILTILIDSFGDTAPSNQIVIDYPLQVQPLVLTAGPNLLFSVDLTTIGIIAGIGNLPYTFSLFSGSLPTGYSLTSAGVLSGTTSVAGVYPVIIQVQDALGVAVWSFVQIVIQNGLINGQVFEINGAGLGNIYSINGVPI
jgi:hypothetical protein